MIDERAEHEERRAHPRYSPDPWLPVVFASPRSDLRAAGHIVDISEGGAKIVAPPSCPVPLVWGDAVEVTVAYSESARRYGFEGLELQAAVVRVASDASAYVLHVMFRERRLHERLRDYLVLLADFRVDRSANTAKTPPRR